MKRVNSVWGIFLFDIIKLLLGESDQINWENLEKFRETENKTKRNKNTSQAF